MPNINDINGVTIANLAKLDAVLKANISKVNGLTLAAAFTGLLDTYTGAAAGYSTRRLASSATNLMRIREDSGDTETDIGYDSNGDLDTAAIASHCGSANGYVVTWYDQSGNANNATQSTAGNQPQIYNGTAVITENGKPAVFYDGDSMSINVNLSTFDFSLFATYRKTTTTGQAGIFGTGSTTYLNIELNQYGASLYTYYGNTSGTFSNLQKAVNQNLHRLVSVTSGTSDIKMYDNSVLADSATNIANNSTTTATIRPRTSAPVNIQEIIVYNSDQSSNRTGIETDINTYFSIYP